ncbi:class I SAM-dependent methyltransferase [Streptomyces sp. WELS2]|uniref:class I SAM-dependent methyltransferase n=1 Tax=Streptomyces sp. WELS2 TaxID=2749435 RepID=UPI0015F0AC8C|nr:class I SAM-dependent methyltransferase [Streptomyces sp. WELS2]
MGADDEPVPGLCAGLDLHASDRETEAGHFLAAAPRHWAAVRGVGLLPGWRVLVMGRHAFGYLRWIADLVGRRGSVVVVIPGSSPADARGSVLASRLPCPVTVVHTDGGPLPFPDDEFDAAWCAGILDTRAEEEVADLFAEVERVIRPQGVVAVRDSVPHLLIVRPGDPYLITDFRRAAAALLDCPQRLTLGQDVHLQLRHSGFTRVEQHVDLVEYYAPVPHPVRRYYQQALAAVARQAAIVGMDERWHHLRRGDDPGHPLHAPDAYVSEGYVLASGVKVKNTSLGGHRSGRTDRSGVAAQGQRIAHDGGQQHRDVPVATGGGGVEARGQ